jgi:Fe-Mn family superoxide dismutase
MTERRLDFEVNGALLHRLWWENLAPPAPGGRAPKISRAVLSAFGGNAKTLKRELIALGMSIQGSGWVALSWDKRARYASTHVVYNHDYDFSSYEPLLLIDVWEHAYLYDYGGDRKAYLGEALRLVNWAEVEGRLP